MRRNVLLSLLCLTVVPAAAETTIEQATLSAVDQAIMAQQERVAAAYARYQEECFNSTSKNAVTGSTNNRWCEFNQEAFYTEFGLLIRLVHGDPPVLYTTD
jgi:hypothetical protein